MVQPLFNMKIQEALKKYKLVATFQNCLLTIKVSLGIRAIDMFQFTVLDGQENGYWNTIKIAGTLYDISLISDEGETDVYIYGLEDTTKQETDLSNCMKIPFEGEPTEEEKKEFTRKQAESVLLITFSAIPMDKPDNFEAILDFIVSDVLKSAESEYVSHGDIIESFKNFLEKVQ